MQIRHFSNLAVKQTGRNYISKFQYDVAQERYVLSDIFVIVGRFSQKLQAHKLNMIKREKLATHPRTIWRIWLSVWRNADFENQKESLFG